MEREAGTAGMNVYDFDNTIYRGDSTADLILFLWTHYPKTLLNLPRTAVLGLLYGIRVIPKMTFKQNVYHMFVYIKDIDAVVEEFIRTHKKNIKNWYYEQQRPDDLVISASPEFIIRRFCHEIGIEYAMASEVDPHTGKCGPNCHGREKVKRFYEMYPDGKIEQFYSDSYSDSPLAEIADEAFLVKGDRRLPWGEGR